MMSGLGVHARPKRHAITHSATVFRLQVSNRLMCACVTATIFQFYHSLSLVQNWCNRFCNNKNAETRMLYLPLTRFCVCLIVCMCCVTLFCVILWCDVPCRLVCWSFAAIHSLCILYIFLLSAFIVLCCVVCRVILFCVMICFFIFFYCDLFCEVFFVPCGYLMWCVSCVMMSCDVLKRAVCRILLCAIAY